MNQLPERSVLKCADLDQQREFYVQAREIVSDLFQPEPWCFWLDFVVSMTSAYVLASIWLALPTTSPIAWLAFFAGATLLYRSSMFIHELVHLSAKQMKWFRRVWNFFAGVPMMVPSFSYASHLHHHSSRHYGTKHDGEYLPLATGSLKGILIFLTQIFSQPIIVFLRYAIGTPISFLHSRLRKWTLAHASSLVINFQYQKELKSSGQSASDTFWELFTCFRTWVMLGLVLTGIMPAVRLPKLFMLAMFALALNHIRTLAAHRYTNDGETISHLDQFLDSTNVQGNWLTELLCPLGSRYHALHHLFPRILYHNLGIAHRRLVSQLAENSVYHDATYPSIWSAIRDLLENVRAHQKNQTV